MCTSRAHSIGCLSASHPGSKCSMLKLDAARHSVQVRTLLTMHKKTKRKVKSGNFVVFAFGFFSHHCALFCPFAFRLFSVHHLNTISHFVLFLFFFWLLRLSFRSLWSCECFVCLLSVDYEDRKEAAKNKIWNERRRNKKRKKQDSNAN